MLLAQEVSQKASLVSFNILRSWRSVKTVLPVKWIFLILVLAPSRM